jgi:hypothetical protein
VELCHVHHIRVGERDRKVVIENAVTRMDSGLSIYIYKTKIDVKLVKGKFYFAPGKAQTLVFRNDMKL